MSIKKSKLKILIADDEIDMLDFIRFVLEREGYEVITAKDGIQAIKLTKELHPDLLLLDIMMPNLEGTEVCEHLRNLPEFANLPIVFLTARSGEAVEVNAFQIGADDFINKPIKPNVLVARIENVLRRKNQSVVAPGIPVTTISNAVIDHENYRITYNSNELVFAKKEFKLIELLASKPGKVFTRKEIFDRVWGSSLLISDRTIDVHISKIRNKTAENFIKTVKGMGYKIEA